MYVGGLLAFLNIFQGGLDNMAEFVPALGEQLGPLEAGHAL